ncbi:uncharacterized protein LOC123004129 [Tribolium madens]|uniref:uncharacterized protein LOC123004129 n=1 Tax=Tribolium madens TaxID=41895 RepID=UPI001CF73D44|nr:uncharacterized protein LOC123004129 [Tribolium madens]
MSLLVLILLALTSYVTAASKLESKATGCSLNILVNNVVTPLFLNSSFQFPNPTYNGATEVEFDKDEILYIGCPNADTTQSNFPLVPGGEEARCVEGELIYAITSNKTVNFNALTCHQQFRPYYREIIPSSKCESNFTVRYIGQVIANKVIRVVKLCFDTTKILPLYSKYTTNKWSDLFVDYNSDINFNYVSNGLFDNLVPWDVYKQTKQTMENLGVFGYITDDVYLVPGQLAVYDDFLSPYQRDLTFDYANTAFQWNTIKNGNWKNVVSSLQSLITKGKDFGEVTMLGGTLRIASLPNKSGSPVELFLSGDGRMPVPSWFWKLFFSKSDYSAIMFFVYNNPYVEKSVVDKELKTICQKDVLNDLHWVKGIDNTNAKAGFTYACLVARNYMVDEVIREIVNNVLNEQKFGSGLLQIPMGGGQIQSEAVKVES